jgi:hypothetical protein
VKKYIVFLLFCGLTLCVNAQRGFEAGGWLGVSNYFGDLNTNFRLDNVGPAGGVALRYNFNNRICLRLGGNVGVVQASDSDSDNLFERTRNLSFKSKIADASLLMEFNFLPYDHGSRDYFWTPYLFAGFGATKFDPMAKINEEWVELRPLATEGQFKGEEYSLVSGHWAYGGGFKIDLSFEWSLNIEVSARRMGTDYLDDVSTVYPDLEDLEQAHGSIAVALSDRSVELLGSDLFESNGITKPVGGEGRQRGNSRNKDTYIYIGVGVMYYFGDLLCPYER